VLDWHFPVAPKGCREMLAALRMARERLSDTQERIVDQEERLSDMVYRLYAISRGERQTIEQFLQAIQQ